MKRKFHKAPMDYNRTPGRGGRRGASGRGRGDASSQKRRVFTKLVKDEKATISSIHQAKRFVEGMETFDSKVELLSKLDDTRDMGVQRIRDVLSFVNSTNDVEMLLIPMLHQVMNDETARPLFRPLRDKILMAIFSVPGLMDALVRYEIASQIQTVSAHALSSFLLAIVKTFVEARMSVPVLELARSLRERDDVNKEAIPLCAILLADEEPPVNPDVKTDAPSNSTTACWVTDIIPPGGRHDNDHRNFRNIRIVPTVDELRCPTDSWLPLATGENQVIENAGIRLLDKNFRLLREDAVHTMKTNIAEQQKPWRNARIVGLNVKGRGAQGNLSFVVQCDSRPGGNPDWRRSRALMQGTVVAFCRDGVPTRLGTITLREDESKGEWLNAPGGPKIGVSFDCELDFDESVDEMLRNSAINERVCELTTRLGSKDLDSAQQVRSQLKSAVTRLVTYDLIEASKSFFTYQPILRTLQSMEGVPMSKELVDLDSAVEGRPTYLPEKIALPKGADFGGYVYDFDSWSPTDVTEKTSLDLSQAKALHHALTSRVSLIQGPPGTGKTFIGSLIAQVIRENTDESILCVCYTNHALDQFLEHMIKGGESRIVRLGGRSKSPEVAQYQLRELARQKARLDADGTRRLKQVDAQLYRQRDIISEHIAMLNEPIKWGSPCGGVHDLLSSEYPEIRDFLRVPEPGEGFELCAPNGKKVRSDFLWTCWKKGQAFPQWMIPYLSDEISYDFQVFWNHPHDERLVMIENWRREVVQSETEGLHGAVDMFNSLNQEKRTIVQEKDLQVLHQARVIGATTTGAAQFHELLAAKSAGVVIVEEAGEVLESHVLTALSEISQDSVKETKHLILIGDHKQLRPKVENYQLTAVSKAGYNLDCSLFERLVLSNLSSVALEVQHRMRPSISSIIRAQTYPSLRDHESVHDFPNIKGVTQNLVFIDHRVLEDGEQADEDLYGNTKTKTSIYEAELCIEMVRYFLLQGYSSDSVVILTPYLGQLMEILRLVKTRLKEVMAFVSEHDQKDLDTFYGEGSEVNSPADDIRRNSVRCSSIDNFQGEEADIIIISLVRSNTRGNIGFLKEEQRVNVLLSRARHGMFLVGNSKTLRQGNGNRVWGPILSMMEESGQLMKGLPTICQLHPDADVVELCKPIDFRTVRPNGGCGIPCNFRMQCGHVCPKACHPIDRAHRMAQQECCEPCRRFPSECTREHTCSKLCKEDCGPCRADIGEVMLTCGHAMARVTCHDVRSEDALQMLSGRCKAKLTHGFEPCGHKVETTCNNARSAHPICPATCSKMSKCGHPCMNRCGTCESGHDCKLTCDRPLFCGHACYRPCHQPEPCEPCEKRCSVKCIHSSCPDVCYALCTSCVEPCDWMCEHKGKCDLVCGAPCSRLPCNERCQLILGCGHQCPSVCGEPCPPSLFCQECATQAVKAHVVDMICLSTYEDHDVTSDPIICLPCKHHYSISTLDGHLGFSEVYTSEDNGPNWTGLRSLRGANVNEKTKCCPDCRAAIHSIRRYGRLLRLVELRGLERKHLMSIDRALDSLADPDTEGSIFRLEKLVKTIERSPMRAVYEACGGCDEVEVPPPPSRPLIRALELLGRAYAAGVAKPNDGNYTLAKETYERAILVATQTTSIRSGAVLRIALATFFMNWGSLTQSLKAEALLHLDWVIDNCAMFSDLVAKAKELKRDLDDYERKTIAKVVSAMNKIDGYNYGGSWSSHWYECPNGHPYFIGDCGGAMETSHCIECGEPVGGNAHRLLSSNRTAGGLVREVSRP